MNENQVGVLAGMIWGYLESADCDNLRVDVVGDSVRVVVDGKKHMFSRKKMAADFADGMKQLAGLLGG